MAKLKATNLKARGLRTHNIIVEAKVLNGSATAEERDNYHRDAYENARNHASGPPAARG